MKILIIGGSGFIGYNIYKNFKSYFDEIEFTYFKNKILDDNARYLDATNFEQTREIIIDLEIIQRGLLRGQRGDVLRSGDQCFLNKYVAKK